MPSKAKSHTPVLYTLYGGSCYHPACYRKANELGGSLHSSGKSVEHRDTSWTKGKRCGYCKGMTGKPLKIVPPKKVADYHFFGMYAGDKKMCKAHKFHLKSCDDDGYCNYCGEQY